METQAKYRVLYDEWGFNLFKSYYPQYYVNGEWRYAERLTHWGWERVACYTASEARRFLRKNPSLLQANEEGVIWEGDEP